MERVHFVPGWTRSRARVGRNGPLHLFGASKIRQALAIIQRVFADLLDDFRLLLIGRRSGRRHGRDHVRRRRGQRRGALPQVIEDVRAQEARSPSVCSRWMVASSSFSDSFARERYAATSLSASLRCAAERRNCSSLSTVRVWARAAAHKTSIPSPRRNRISTVSHDEQVPCPADAFPLLAGATARARSDDLRNPRALGEPSA